MRELCLLLPRISIFIFVGWLLLNNTPSISVRSQSATLTSNQSSSYFQEYKIPTNNSVPGPITVAPDGKVWFIEANPSKLAAFNPLTHNFTEYSFPPAYISAQDLTTVPRGDLWFTLLGSNAIGSYNISSRSF